VTSGQPAPSAPVARTTLPVAATLRGAPAIVDFSGLAPGFAGLYQVNLLVPEIAAGTAEVVLSVDGVSSNAVTMEVGAR
jgi:adhesin/invasin